MQKYLGMGSNLIGRTPLSIGSQINSEMRDSILKIYSPERKFSKIFLMCFYR
jgi:hypothetical protein